MPHARAIAIVDGPRMPLEADEQGFIHLLLPPTCPERIQVMWGPQEPSEPLCYALDIIPDCDVVDTPNQDRNRLHNLGYELDLPFEHAAKMFQRDYSVDLDKEHQPRGLIGGELPEASRQRVRRIYEEMECDASVS